MSNSPDGTWTR